MEIKIPLFSPNKSSLSPFFQFFFFKAQTPIRPPRVVESLLVESELIDVDIHSPPCVKAITLLFAWCALCGGVIPLGDGSLTQEYAWVEKN